MIENTTYLTITIHHRPFLFSLIYPFGKLCRFVLYFMRFEIVHRFFFHVGRKGFFLNQKRVR